MTVLDKIAEIKVVPVVKLDRAEDTENVMGALCRGGITAAEITFRTACAAEAIEIACKKFPDMLIGAGTVINAEQAVIAARILGMRIAQQPDIRDLF